LLLPCVKIRAIEIGLYAEFSSLIPLIPNEAKTPHINENIQCIKCLVTGFHIQKITKQERAIHTKNLAPYYTIHSFQILPNLSYGNDALRPRIATTEITIYPTSYTQYGF
jgi:hypothetical protein